MALALLSLPYLSLQHLERSPAYEGNASTLSLLEASQVIADLESLSEAHGNPTVVVYANHDQWETLHYLARGRLSVSNVEGQSLYLPDRAESGLLFAFVADAADTPDGAAEPDLRPRLARAVGFVEVETPRNPAHSGNGPASYFYRGSYDGSGSLLAALPAGLELDLSNGLRLRSINLPSESSAVKPGSLTLEWRLPDEPASQQWTDYITFVQLRDPTGRLIASNDLALTQYRMLQRAGGSLLTAHQLPAPSADEHALATVNFGLYEKYSRQNATWRLAEGQSADHAQLGSLRIVPSVEHDGGTPVRGVVFSGLLELIGYSEPTWKGTVSERELSITTNWRSLKPTDANLTFSIQLLDSTGKLVGQTDSQPRNGALPTSALRDGELFTDTREVVLTSPQQGPLSIHIVVYNGETGERLATAQGSSYLLQVLP